jgi:hypothetical protein
MVGSCIEILAIVTREMAETGLESETAGKSFATKNSSRLEPTQAK